MLFTITFSLILNCYISIFKGNQPGYNVQAYSNTAILKQFQRLTKLFTLLKNYTNDVIKEYASSGVPVQRPLFLMYENDVTAQNVKFQYMYGPDLLVAPVIESKATSWKVYLPKGDSWVHLWNNTKYNGGSFVTVPSPIGLPPVFYRQGSNYTSIFTQMSKIKPVVIPSTTKSPSTSNPVPTCNPQISSASTYRFNQFQVIVYFLIAMFVYIEL